MRTLRDPLTIAAIAFTAFSAIADASAAKSQANAEAAFLQVQAQQERVARARELRDSERAAAARLSRTRALIAAGGGDTTVGTGLALLTDQTAEALLEQQRLLSDSQARERSLTARASNAKARGRAEFRNTLLRAVGSSLSTAARAPRAPSKVGFPKSFGPQFGGDIRASGSF